MTGIRGGAGRLSLRLKLAALVATVLVVTGSVLGCFWIWKSQRILDQELRRRGTSLAQFAAYSGRFATFTEDRTLLQGILSGMVNEEDVAFAAFTDAEGNVLAEQSEEFPGDLGAVVRAALKTPGLVHRFEEGGRGYYDLYAPVTMEPRPLDRGLDLGDEAGLFGTPAPVSEPSRVVTVGYVHVGLSLQGLRAETARTVQWTMALTLGAVGLAVLVVLLIAKRIVGPVQRMVDVAARVARGDYSQTIDVGGGDEVGALADAFRQMQGNLRELAGHARSLAEGDMTRKVDVPGDLSAAFNQMVESLSQLVGHIKEAGDQVSSASNEILAASTQQERGSQDQASSIADTTTTMDELLSASKQIASSADSVVEIAERTLAAAQAGQEAVQEAIAGMEQIRENNRRTAERILELSERNQQIGAIVEIIDEIADKTDLLALNAAIEGAKAGEAGKGFSVVAMEMRALAENVVESTKEIKEIISEIQKASQASVLATEGQMKTSETGVGLAVRTGEQLQRILEMVEQTTEAAKQISLATQQQRTGTEQVVHSMSEIATIAKQNVSGSERTTRCSMELSNLADELKRGISRFRLAEEREAEGPTLRRVSSRSR